MKANDIGYNEAKILVERAIFQRAQLDVFFWNDFIPYVELESFPKSKQKRILDLSKMSNKSGADLWFLLAEFTDKTEGAEQDEIRDIVARDIKDNATVQEVVAYTDTWWDAWTNDTRSDIDRPAKGILELLRMVSKKVHGKMGHFISAQLSSIKMNPEFVTDGTRWVEKFHEALIEEKSVFDSDVGSAGFVIGDGGRQQTQNKKKNSCGTCKTWGCTGNPKCVIIDKTIPTGKGTAFPKSTFYVNEARKALAANPSLNLKEWKCPPNPKPSFEPKHPAKKSIMTLSLVGAPEPGSDEAELLKPMQEEYRSLLGILIYISRLRYDVAMETARLASFLKTPTPEAMEHAMQVAAYLRANPHFSAVFGGGLDLMITDVIPPYDRTQTGHGGAVCHR